MKLIAINIQQGGGRRIDGLIDYLVSYIADILILTEYRYNANSERLRIGLAEYGYQHFAERTSVAKENSICIIAKNRFEIASDISLQYQDRHRLITANFDSFRLLGVYFAQNQAKKSLFDYLISSGHHNNETPTCIIGDFNTGIPYQDERGKTFYCANEFSSLLNAGLIDSWRIRHAGVKEYSWFSHQGNGFRIDHILSNLAADAMIQSVEYDHTPRTSKMSDHAALVVEFKDSGVRAVADTFKI